MKVRSLILGEAASNFCCLTLNSSSSCFRVEVGECFYLQDSLQTALPEGDGAF